MENKSAERTRKLNNKIVRLIKRSKMSTLDASHFLSGLAELYFRANEVCGEVKKLKKQETE